MSEDGAEEREERDGDGRVVVIGGGVIGLCCAYYLARSGRAVLVLEREAEGGNSCSRENAGMVVPSHFVPLAAPGVITQGLKWLLDPESPFYVRPRVSLSLLRWGLGFMRHANRKHVERTSGVLLDLHLRSRKLFEELAEEGDFGLTKRGLLMLCETQEQLDEEAELAERARGYGLGAEVCDRARVRELDPDIEMEAKGAVWFEEDCHLDPQRFLGVLRRLIRAHGGEIRYNAKVVGIRNDPGPPPVAVLEDGEKIAGETFVLAGGAWTPELGRALGISIPMQAGKGYSLTLREPAQVARLCSILTEARVAVTPMGEAMRFAGTMEICGNDLSVNERRVQGIIKAVCRVFPRFSPDDFTEVTRWAGLRPCTPDGLPYIGRHRGSTRVILATGHAMLGLSLGPITGKLVADCVAKGDHGIPSISPGRGKERGCR